MTLALVLAGIGTLVIALVLVSRRLDPIGNDVTPDRVERPVRPVTPSDVPDAWIGWDGPESRTTPLPRSEPVATGWRARMSRHVASRHERGDDVAHTESLDDEGAQGACEEEMPAARVDGRPVAPRAPNLRGPLPAPSGGGSPRVVELAPGVHASRQSMDEWIGERIGRAPYTRASLAQGAAREYRCSLRTAQRAVTRIITDRGSTK